MDTVSDISGLMALAALAAQTVIQTVNTLKTLKDLPDDLRSVLEWLDRLSSLVKNIQLIPPDTPIKPLQLQMLAVHVRAASDAVTRLSTKVEAEISSLDIPHKVKRQAKKVRILLAQKGTGKQVRDVAQAVEALHLCHSEVCRQLLCKTYSDVVSISRRLDESILQGNDMNAKIGDIILQVRNFDLTRIREEEIFRQISANIHTSSSRLEESLRDLDANTIRGKSIQSSLQRHLKASLIAEVKSAVVQELKVYCDDLALQRIKGEPTPTRISTVNSSEGEKVPYFTGNQMSSSLWGDAHAQGLGQCFSNDEPRRTGGVGANTLGMPFLSVQTAWMPSCKNQFIGYQTDKILNYKASFPWLGSLAVVIHRRIIATDYLIYRFIILEVSITPNPRLFSRGLSFALYWDVEQGQRNALTNIRLFLPRILKGDDPLLNLLHNGTTEGFIRLFQTGGYNARDQVYYECGSWDLVSEAFSSVGNGCEICIFLLQYEAKLPFEVWEGLIGYYLRVESEKALQITRLMMANGSGPEFVPALPPISFELVFNAISAHPNSVPDWVMHSNHNWAQNLHLHPVETALPSWGPADFYDCNYDVDRDALVWKSLMRRSEVGVEWEDSLGDTCWSYLLGYCRHAFEKLSKNPVLESILETRMKGLLRMHANPCQTNAEGMTSTIQAFAAYERGYGSDLELGVLIGPFWISALLASNVNVTAVARHSFRLLWDNNALLRLLNFGHGLEEDLRCCGHDECHHSPFNSPEQLANFLLDAFEKCGIYPDESWWVKEEEEPDGQKSSTMAVDFTPQTMYDIGKRDMEVKRRKGRDMEEE